MKDITKAANLLSRLDRIPVTRTMISIMILLLLAWVFESFDVGMMGTIIISAKHAWNLTEDQVGFLGIATTLGVVIGLIPGGRLTDKFGRRTVLLWGTAIYGLLTFFSAFSPNLETLIVLRVLAGLGEGAIFPIPYLMLSEFVQSNKRGISMGWVNGALTGAYAFPLMIGAWATNAFPLEKAWEVMSLFGGIPLLFVIPLLIWLPESPRFLVKKGRYEELEKIVEKLEKQANLSQDTSLVNPSILNGLQTTEMSRGKMGDIFKPPYMIRSVVAYLVFGYSIYVWYVLNVYGPTMFSNQGLGVNNALTFTAIMMAIAALGTVVHGYLSDKYGRKVTLVVFGAAATICFLLFAYTQSYNGLIILGILSAFFGLSIVSFGKLYTSEQYPTDIRGLGTATGEMTGRFFSGVAGLYFIPQLLAWGGNQVVFISMAVFIVLGTIPLIILGRDTHNISVEEAGSSVLSKGKSKLVK
ncbi:MFS transporter [Neobacillus mesonae]|uniref:MFS transporter n=1 Tax=Neobacillus mesonae TaxID=1193713 RepID=UPI00203ADDD5|nr:MFS transporter [Neobacillus mesonae]MCM3571110.1 MFS transporter [Neobacillus mesonae]